MFFFGEVLLGGALCDLSMSSVQSRHSCNLLGQAPTIKVVGVCECPQFLCDWSTSASLHQIAWWLRVFPVLARLEHKTQSPVHLWCFAAALARQGQRANPFLHSLYRFPEASTFFFAPQRHLCVSTFRNGRSDTKIESLFWVVPTLFRF